ncbi:hypothetical protein D3C87_1710250 [compost metagenome]
MAQHHDLVHALGTQRINLRLRCDGFVRKQRAGVRAGRLLRLVGNRQADEADGLAIALQHDGRLDQARRARRIQRGPVGKGDVGA